LVEAKAGESADARKLNFNKVAPLFEDRFTVRSVLALNMNEKKVIKQHLFCKLHDPSFEIVS
jgi:hypothetical protein